MASQAEQLVSRSLRTILASLPDGANIPDSKQFREGLSGLEFFLPGVLAEIYSFWKGESLDGIYPVLARKTGDGKAEFFRSEERRVGKECRL